MTNLAITIRNKWLTEDAVLKEKYSESKHAVSIIDALAQVVADYRSNK